MKEVLVTFETAKLAKEKGFNLKVRYSYGKKEEVSKECLNSYKDANFNYYTGTYWQISAPKQSLLQKWLREIHKIEVFVQPIDVNTYVYCFGNISISMEHNINKEFNTYEEALEEGLQQALKLIEL